MKKISTYERGGVLFIRTSSQTTTGIWIDEGPCSTLPVHAPAAEVGQLVIDKLSSSRSCVPHPSSWTRLNDELLQAAGVRSWNTFGKSAKCVNVESVDCLVFTPTENLGPKHGFVALEDCISKLPTSASSFEVGQELLASLSKSRVGKR